MANKANEVNGSFLTQPAWLAWAAGIVDGEGCIQLVRYNRKKGYQNWQIRLTVANTDPRMLKRLQEILGGSIWADKRKVAGRRPIWNWGAACKKAEAALAAIRPWLVAKAEQADIALQSRRLVSQSRGKKFLSESETTALSGMVVELRGWKRKEFVANG